MVYWPVFTQPAVTKKLLEGNIKNKLLNIQHGNNFLDLTPKAQAAIAEIDQ